MKQLVARLRNVAANVNEGTLLEANRESQDAKDILAISNDLENHLPPGLTKVEYDTINELHAIYERLQGVGDGLDKELHEHIQAIQKILMIRGGSRCWAYIKSENPQAYGPYNQ